MSPGLRSTGTESRQRCPAGGLSIVQLTSRGFVLFPALCTHLEAAFNKAEAVLRRPPAASDFVITRYSDVNANLRTQLQRIIRRAGLTPWGRLWHNLRATGQTELAGRHPAHVVCSSLRNTEAVAREHYLRVTDADFEAAVGAPAAQNPTQQPPALDRNASHADTTAHEKPPELLVSASTCDSSQYRGIPPRGVEPLLPD